MFIKNRGALVGENSSIKIATPASPILFLFSESDVSHQQRRAWHYEGRGTQGVRGTGSNAGGAQQRELQRLTAEQPRAHHAAHARRHLQGHRDLLQLPGMNECAVRTTLCRVTAAVLLLGADMIWWCLPTVSRALGYQ